MVVFDATMLMLLIRPDSAAPPDPEGLPVSHVAERVAHLIEVQEKARTKIGIPTPALSEVLVRSGANAARMVEKIKEFAIFEILPFDELSAIEMAIMTKNAIDAGDKKSGSTEIWSKVKFDRQILAIARVRQASAIYTDDLNLRALSRKLDIAVFGIADLELPLEKAQRDLFSESRSEISVPTMDEIDQAREAEP